MRKIAILIFCLLQISITAKSQETKSENNLDLELGLGYNTLNWQVTSLNENVGLTRNGFAVLPSLKLKYSIKFSELRNNSMFELTPFVGYNMFGGKSKTESNGYKDIIRLQSFEIGVLPTFSLNHKVNLYGGVKGQYIFSAKNKSYGSILSPIDTDRNWETNDISDLIKDISFNIGAGFNYRINSFSLGIETWFGITNLSDTENLKIYENNYRLIIGYRIE
ncbi:outer membrane beta-barrel protein [Draconibacterium halophilum]|uniref:PorT family protein n=1 Tax=Draconibacterium halophilum TaxID=2706887 RepID=A0A6C0RI57_9BACT|nr:outer membrane beta-barrel protein [Draconibacterium halophilum]QIA09757.1 PorT family protein [Draconibacterium halophilum]